MLDNALIDTLLVGAGAVLIVVGLALFVKNKQAGDASSVEALGIKLNVTHPSLILVLAGVGLMLAPRLLPESNTATDRADTLVAPDEQAQPAPVLDLPTPAPTPAINYPASAPVDLPEPTPAPITAIDESAPVVHDPLQPAPMIARSSPPAVTAMHAAATGPLVLVAARAERGTQILPDGESHESYARQFAAAVRDGVATHLGANVRELQLSPREFDTWWRKAGAALDTTCAAPPQPRAIVRVLLGAGDVPPTGGSNTGNLEVRLYDCSAHRGARTRKNLGAQSVDAWPFASGLAAELERFFSAQRGKLN